MSDPVARMLAGITDQMRAPRVAPDWIVFAPEAWMGGPFTAFRSDTGIDGLAILSGREIDLLSVNAHLEGSGQFRSFVKACKQRCDRIGVWEIWNPVLGEALHRYGFVKAKGFFGADSKGIEGMEWKR